MTSPQTKDDLQMISAGATYEHIGLGFGIVSESERQQRQREALRLLLRDVRQHLGSPERIAA